MFKDFWTRLFAKKNTTHISDQVSTPEEEPKSYDYGFDSLGFSLMSHDYDWDIEPFKKVTLVNARACEEKINVLSIASAWRGTEHSEWEFLLAGLLVADVLEAIENNEEEADISNLFNRDLKASRGREFSQDKVYNHIIKWFDFVSETPDELKLRLK